MRFVFLSHYVAGFGTTTISLLFGDQFARLNTKSGLQSTALHCVAVSCAVEIYRF